MRVASVPLKSVAFPYEHGGWGLTLEPIALGLLVTPTWAGLGLGFFALCAFLIRHPLKLWLADMRQGMHYPRTVLAVCLGLIYGGLALAGLLGAALQAEGPFWFPLVLAAPWALVQLFYDAFNRGRHLLPEVSGAIAMSSVASGIALAGGAELGMAFGLWFVLGARAIASIYFARAQVLRARGVAVRRAPIYGVFLLMFLASLCAVLAGWIPKLAMLALLILALGAAHALSRPPVPARVVGWSQVAFGLVTVLLTAVGIKFGL
jgi:hypothetical protein